jgi:hypothetical protein
MRSAQNHLHHQRSQDSPLLPGMTHSIRQWLGLDDHSEPYELLSRVRATDYYLGSNVLPEGMKSAMRSPRGGMRATLKASAPAP